MAKRKSSKAKKKAAPRAAAARKATVRKATVRKAKARKPAVRRAAPRKAASRKSTRTAKRSPARSEQARLEANKKLVLTMYQHLIGDKDFDKARPYLGDYYRQHAPYARDGHDGVRDWVKGFKEAFPNHRYEVKKVIAEGDFVVLHLHGMNGPNPHGESVVDMFRVKDGKVIEHWDVIQAIPDSADNANSMF